MAALAQILGSPVFDHAGTPIDLETHCYGKVVGLYFSAHWCPPCQEFTPILADFYNKFHNEKNFEIIFISSDEDEGSFAQYYSEMPWLTISFDEKEKIEELNMNYEVNGIPSLVLIDANTGDLLQRDARTPIQFEDLNGELFPWSGMTFD